MFRDQEPFYFELPRILHLPEALICKPFSFILLQRCSKMTAKHKGIVLDFSRQKIDNSIMDLLCSLADKAELGMGGIFMSNKST